MDTNCPDFRAQLSRRMFLASAGAFVAWAGMPRHSYAAGRQPRLLTVVLRGAMDGLAVVPPVGDGQYEAMRGELAIGVAGRQQVLPLDGFFGLNPALPGLHRLYGEGDALIVHAAATPYRERSHFDGQDVLESGMTGPRGSASGWMNRLAEAMPRGGAVAPVSGLAASQTVPLILRGAAPTLTWSPPLLSPVSEDTAQRLLALYQSTDPALAEALASGMMVDGLAGGTDPQIRRARSTMEAFRTLAGGAARLVAAEDGPRIAVLSYDGWDTHTSEGAEEGRLADLLMALDGALTTLRDVLAPVWDDTVVAVVTEFGRTARVNGSEGTDHGTATAAFLLGGAVKGGRVLADWPGLAEGQLYEGRDLAPTVDLRAVFKGIARDHLGVDERTLASQVFPDSLGVRPLDGLVR